MEFEELLRERGVQFKHSGEHHHATVGYLQLDCPFCSKDSGRYRLGYNLHHHFFTCWTCGKLPFAATASALTGLPVRELPQLERDFGHVEEQRDKPAGGKLVLPKGTDVVKAPHRLYLKRRGFDPREIVRKWGVQGIGPHGRLAWRLFIPIHLEEKVVSWTTRSTGDAGRRYISAKADQEILHHKSLLYGLDHVDHTIVVVEGPMDVWRIGYGAVATFGTSCSSAQVELMSRFPRRVIVFDNEKAAQRKAKQLCQTLEGLPGETINVTLSGKDPADSPMKEIEELRRRFLK